MASMHSGRPRSGEAKAGNHVLRRACPMGSISVEPVSACLLHSASVEHIVLQIGDINDNQVPVKTPSQTKDAILNSKREAPLAYRLPGLTKQ